MVAELHCGFAKDGAGMLLFHRRSRILLRARTLKRIPTLLNLAVQVPGFTAGTDQFFEFRVIRFEIFVCNSPVLNNQFGVSEGFPVPLFDVCLPDEIGRLKTPRLAIPVNAASAETCSWQEGFPFAYWQGAFARVVAECHRLGRDVLHHSLTDCKLELVMDT